MSSFISVDQGKDTGEYTRATRRVKAGPKAYFVTDEGQAYAFHYNPDLAPIRDHAGFKTLLQKVPKMSKDLIWSDQKR